MDRNKTISYLQLFSRAMCRCVSAVKFEFGWLSVAVLHWSVSGRLSVAVLHWAVSRWLSVAVLRWVVSRFLADSVAVLHWVVSRFLAGLFFRMYRSQNRKTRSLDCSMQFFIQCHRSRNLRIELLGNNRKFVKRLPCGSKRWTNIIQRTKCTPRQRMLSAI